MPDVAGERAGADHLGVEPVARGPGARGTRTRPAASGSTRAPSASDSFRACGPPPRCGGRRRAPRSESGRHAAPSAPARVAPGACDRPRAQALRRRGAGRSRPAMGRTARKIGPADHAAFPSPADNETVLDDRLPAVLTEIRSLLHVPADATLRRAPSSSTRSRAATRMRSRSRAASGGWTRACEGHSERRGADEVTELTRHLAHADQELAGVRSLLSSVRAQAR